MSIISEFEEAVAKVEEALGNEGAAVKHVLKEALRLLHIHAAVVEKVADDTAAVATDVEDVAKEVPVPGAEEVAAVAGDVAEVADEVAHDAAES